MDHETLKERTIAQQAERQKAFEVGYLDDKVTIDHLDLQLVTNFKSAFDPIKLAVRYTPLLARYDYLVGDISADQLRLKGFYKNSRAVPGENKIFALEDYLYEYVNFGAPYFVLENLTPRAPRKNTHTASRKHRSRNYIHSSKTNS
ncbi:YutD family protein [Convivina praedatoris]|uniref:Uncharacterized protein n=1 Tax=Convivina praedatoris TaxID=2880963 RepID=A0ABN8H9H2_9LACO|nr:YutD family protein [Convivina sp. LMG 32447]CAH1852330.1 hypothetical protein R077815_00546 [Convivina sp. LMG 32447]CAH1853590.1 hypothetical protein R078138_00684 [Convivina sp. LMG 32447]CAH1854474.1 hypothetical protein LMG032447_00878 [Convivina sp. LMG 32447]